MSYQTTETSQGQKAIYDAVLEHCLKEGSVSNKTETPVIEANLIPPILTGLTGQEWSIMSSTNGSSIIYDHSDNIVLVPASHHRRQVVNGEVKPRRPEDNYTELSEASFIGLRTDTAAEAQQMVTEMLTQVAYEHGSLLKGGEYEFSIWGGDNEVLSKYFKELSQIQRETGIAPMNGTFNGVVSEHIREDILRETRQFKAFVNMASSHPAEINIDDTYILDNAYVQLIARNLQEDKVQSRLEAIESFDPQIVEEWNKIARALSFQTDSGTHVEFQDFRDLIAKYDDLRYWVMNSLHVSFDMPTYHDATGSETAFRAVTNLTTYFRNCLNGLCYSGGTTFETDIESIKGIKSEDSREILRNIMITSLPGELILPEHDIKLQMIDHVLGGTTNIADRAAQPVTVNTEDGPLFLTANHGDVRWRVSLPLPQFIKTQIEYNQLVEEGRFEEADHLVKQLGTSIRLEYTSRPATPDLRKYSQSVALQEVLTLAGLTSVAEGYDDVFMWLEDLSQGELITVNEAYTTTSTKTLYEEAKDTMGGVVNRNKTERLYQLCDVLQSRLNELGLPFNPQIFERAKEGLDALTTTFNPYDEGLNAKKRWEIYLESPGNYRNYGHFVNTLKSGELSQILNEYGYDTSGLTRGQKLVILNDLVLELTS